MSSEREQVLKDILEKTAADLKGLSLTVDNSVHRIRTGAHGAAINSKPKEYQHKLWLHPAEHQQRTQNQT